MIASVHIADVGVRRALAALRSTAWTASVPGLRHANTAIAAPLSGKLTARPQVGRLALIGFWDDEAAIDDFVASHPVGGRLRRGWSARLEPLRMFGSWPGVPDDLPTRRDVDHDGPAAVLTLGQLRLSQAPRFVRTSARAEASVLAAPGLRWATGLARPPFVSTFSLWESSRALATYAYGRRDPGHPDAIEAGEGKAFHHQQAFIRFRPLSTTGALDGTNPLSA